MKSYISSIFKYAILLGIGIILLVSAFRGQDLNILLNELERADYGWVIASTMACFLAHVLRALRWRMLIESLGHGSPTLLNTFYAVMIGYLANLAFPRMGEVSRCGAINKTNNIPLMKLIGTVIIERVADLLMLCMVIAIAIFLQFEVLSDFLYRSILSKLTGRIGDVTILIFAVTLLILAIALFFLMIKKKHLGFSGRMYNLYIDMKSGIVSVKNLENKTGFILCSILLWLFYGLSTYLCFFALASTSGLGPLAALSVLVFGSLAMIAPVQGGIGAFHWMVSEGLTIYDIQKSDGLAYALLTHSSQTLFIFFIGALSLILIMVKSSKQIKNEQAE